MNIRMMRFVDRYLGVPLCWILGSFIRMFARGSPRDTPRPPRRLLVIKFFGMGSIILTTPALTLLRNAFPASTISFLSFDEHRELLERIPSIDEIVTIKRTSVFVFIVQAMRVIGRFFRQPFDVVYDLEFFSKFSTLLSGLSGARVRVAFALPTRWRSFIVTHQSVLDKNQHVTSAFCDVIRCHTQTSGGTPNVVPPLITDVDHASLQVKFPLEGKNLVCINANAGETFLERRWPAERFAELVTRMGEDEGFHFCFIGTERERTYVESIISKTRCHDRCTNMCGLLTLPELGALFQRCALVVSNDSGPLHLAATLRTPTVGLYGPESPSFYGTGYGHGATVYKNIACSPCMNVYFAKDFRCPFHARCMQEISVDEVVDCVYSLAGTVL